MTLTHSRSQPLRHLSYPASMSSEIINVLLLADACNPFGDLEERLGYELSRALARNERLEVTVATHPRNLQALEKQTIDAGQGRLARVVFVDSPRTETRLRRLGTVLQRFGTILNVDEPCDTSAAASVFEKAVYRRFKNDLVQGRFDVIHRLTPTCRSISCAFPDWGEVPTLIGPIRSSHVKPNSRRADANPRDHLLQWRPSALLARDSALVGVVAGSREALSELGEDGPRRFYLPDVELEPERFPMIRSWQAPSPGEPFHFVTSGSLVQEPAIDGVIRAMGASRILRDCRLTIVGEGPESANLQALVCELGLGATVEFRGRPDDRAMKECLRGAQAFVFPSVTESDGGMVVEAMSAGLPVIVRDVGELRSIVDHANGIRLPLDHAEGILNSVRQTMERLVIDPKLCERLGKAGSRRAREHYSWPTKAAMVVGFYENVIDAKVASSRFRRDSHL